jgi:hypothetical protein
VSTPATSLDWVHQRLPSLLVWKLPVGVLFASALFDLSPPVRGFVWALAFATMSFGCVRNALRCRRLHCYFTGPFFLALAGLSLLHGTRVLDLGSNGWSWIGGVALVGGISLIILPERVWGKYAGG